MQVLRDAWLTPAYQDFAAQATPQQLQALHLELCHRVVQVQVMT